MEVQGKKVSSPGGDARVQVRYKAHLPVLYLQGRITCGPYWQGRSSLPCTALFFARADTCGGCVGTPTDLATTIYRLQKKARDVFHEFLQPSGIKTYSYPKPLASLKLTCKLSALVSWGGSQNVS